ncbi:MAG: hypothetical protein ACTHWW_04260 [Arthrobacter sp.]|uniref:hypothetical protein n=1 Tax=Arthrobacter TaxID=1663 RepID=UPI003FB7007A
MPLIAVGALLTGCGAGATAPGSSAPPESAAASSPSVVSEDCSALQDRFAAGDLPQEFYDGVDQGVRVVETTSGTILQDGPLTSEAAQDPDASPSAAEYPDRVEPDPDWPKDSVVFIDPASGDVVKAIDVPDELTCAP